MVRLLPLVSVLLLALALPADADGAEIRVRARTRLTFGVGRVDGGLEVRGRLDDDAHRGVADREVALTMAGWDGAETTRTGPDGEFVYRLGAWDLRALLEGSRRLFVHVGWAGDTRYGPARQERTVDVDKLDVELSATVVPTMAVMGERRDVRLIAEAYAQGRPVRDLELTVSIAGGPPRPLRTGPDGRATAALSTEGLGGPGEVPVQVRAPEAADTNAASAAARLLLVSPTTLTLEVAATEGASPSLRASGLLADARGPVQGGLVTLLADELPVALGVTGEDGRWTVAITRRTLSDACPPDAETPLCRGSRSMTLRGAYSPAEPWRRASVSEPVDALLPEPPRVPLEAYLWALAGALAVMGAAWLVRLRPLARLRRAAPRSASPPPPPPTLAVPPPPTPHEASIPADRVAGVVVDAATGAPVGGASVRAAGDAATTGPDGRFELGPLPPGEHALLIAARGFLPARLPVWVPHHGRVLGLLRSVRDEAAAVYRSRVEPDAGAGAFGLLTPRDIAAFLAERSGHDAAALARLTEAFEHVYYGDACAGPEAVDRVRAAAEEQP